MPKRNILILEKTESPWIEFLKDFFEDTLASLHFTRDSAEAGGLFDSLRPPIVFANPELLSLAFSQKLKVFRQSSPDFRLFAIGAGKSPEGFPAEECFETPEAMEQFQKKFIQRLAFPEKIHVQVVDDEKEIGSMLRDFLENRVAPAFHVDYAPNGKIGIEMMEKKMPDVLVLDIKMPVMDGREAYREIKQRGWTVPVIVFFDAISGDEMTEIHQYGKPAVVDKGSRQSSMPEMMSLVKKMAYFG